MRRHLSILGLLAVASLCAASTALGKGATEATISGPGLKGGGIVLKSDNGGDPSRGSPAPGAPGARPLLLLPGGLRPGARPDAARAAEGHARPEVHRRLRHAWSGRVDVDDPPGPLPVGDADRPELHETPPP